jgi:hypothetical protein
MFVDWTWTNGCDLCEAEVATITAVAQGATGRWCPVMAVCQDCGPDIGYDGSELMSIEDARKHCDSLPNSYADF